MFSRLLAFVVCHLWNKRRIRGIFGWGGGEMNFGASFWQLFLMLFANMSVTLLKLVGCRWIDEEGINGQWVVFYAGGLCVCVWKILN